MYKMLYIYLHFVNDRMHRKSSGHIPRVQLSQNTNEIIIFIKNSWMIWKNGRVSNAKVDRKWKLDLVRDTVSQSTSFLSSWFCSVAVCHLSPQILASFHKHPQRENLSFRKKPCVELELYSEAKYFSCSFAQNLSISFLQTLFAKRMFSLSLQNLTTCFPKIFFFCNK